MAWNKSTGAVKPIAQKTAISATAKWCVGGGTALVAVAGLTYYLCTRNTVSRASGDAHRSGYIKEVTPAKGPGSGGLPPPPPPPKKKVEYKTLENGKIMKYVDGKEAWMYPRQDTAKYGSTTTRLDRATFSIEDRIFDTSSDRAIAYIVNAEPGDEFGDGLSFRNFKERFLKSMAVPIIVTKDDTEEEAALKRKVIEARLELKDRLDSGEDIEKVMESALEGLREAGAYRMQLEKELNGLVKAGEISEDEMGDFVDAANKMLEEKGYKGFSNKSAFVRKIKFRKQYKARKEARQE